jgi:Sulfotransferase domain
MNRMQHQAKRTRAGLWQSVNLWRHKRRWVRRNLERQQNADALIVSHTKSGRTWLRIMISHLYHLRYETPESEIIDYDNLHKLNPAIPRLYFNRDTRVPTFDLNKPYVQVPASKKVLFLVRDPRDVAVSFYFHVCNRASERELSRKGISTEAMSLSLYQFVTHEELGIPRIISHFNRWHEEMQAMPSTLVIHYEQIRTEPVNTLGKIMPFIDRPFDEDELRQAVEFASFDSLSRKEKDGFFTSGRMRPTNPDDAGTFKVRRGKVGGYRDYFTEEENVAIDAMVRERLHPFYCYHDT